MDPRLSEANISEALGEGLVLEYTQDSPMFRNQVGAFLGTQGSVVPYCEGVCHALQGYRDALKSVENAGIELQKAIEGRKLSRCLFSNALPGLGNLGQTLGAASHIIQALSSSLGELGTEMDIKVFPMLEKAAQCCTLDKEKERLRQVEKLSAVYEKKCLAALKTRRRLSEAEENNIVKARESYELARFDLTRAINKVDSNKKLYITEAAACLGGAVTRLETSLRQRVESAQAKLEMCSEVLPEEKLKIERNEHIWDGLRQRLRWEIHGKIAPPGAPLGAGATAYHGPKGHVDCSNTFNTTLSTEVLSSETRIAKHKNPLSTQDAGIHQQGYLITEGKYIGIRTRQWYRLYKTTLYRVTLPYTYSNMPTYELNTVCNVYGATISAKPGSTPHQFTITTTEGRVYDYQAQNEDEAMIWLWALRRCANGGLEEALHSPRVTDSAMQNTSQSADGWLIHNGVDKSENTTKSMIDQENRISDAGEQSFVETEKTESEAIDIIFGDVHSDMQSLVDSKLVYQPSETQAAPEVTVRAGPCCGKIQSFLKKSNFCAECNSSKRIMWVSVNIGVALCEECSNIHARLGWALSKLRCVTLDDFSDWQCNLLLEELGNERSCAILESSVPEGWVKPHPESTFEDKSQWIYAKYRWRAFVDDGDSSTEFRDISNERCLACGLFKAAKEGTIEGLQWWLFHRADINTLCPADAVGGPCDRAPLHEACARSHVNCIAYLVLHGADIFLKDGEGYDALSYVESEVPGVQISPSNRQIIGDIFHQTLRGD